jgi:putative proteasome-type protease
MTYCVGILVRDGLVLVADTRTNAGIDNIATFRKLTVYEKPGEYICGIATSGNLSISQAAISMLQEGLRNPETGALDTLDSMPNAFQAAQLIGRALRELWKIHGESLETHNAKFDVQMLFGGEYRGDRMRLFMIYAAGNFIEVTSDTPYFQIGEHKYGKPILDRAVTFDTELYDALKIGLISMDSTMRSNLGVGLPIDLLVVRRGALAPELNYRIEPSEPYFQDLRERWSAALRTAHTSIPRPPYAMAASSKQAEAQTFSNEPQQQMAAGQATMSGGGAGDGGG